MQHGTKLKTLLAWFQNTSLPAGPPGVGSTAGRLLEICGRPTSEREGGS